jgi:glycosyltransferase involved in cell wall biosynthesis
VAILEDVSLSDRYCLPNKLFECLMAGLPVVVSNLPEMARIVSDWEVGVVVEDPSPAGLQRGIERLMTMDQGTLNANVSAAAQSFSWETQERVLLGAYRGLMNVESNPMKE